MTPVDYLSNKYPKRGSVMATYSKTEVLQMLEEYASSQLEPPVMPVACGSWQKEKPTKECYFIHRYNEDDLEPSLFNAMFDEEILCVFNIQDNEFVETMEEFADGEFYIIEK